MTNEENFAEYFKKNGEEILLNDTLVKGLICDFFSSDTAFKNVLSVAVQAGVVKKLCALKKNGAADIEFEISKITRIFIRENAIMESAAENAVNCFAAILFDKKRRRENAGQKPREVKATTGALGNLFSGRKSDGLLFVPRINPSELIFNTSRGKLKFSISQFWQAIYDDSLGLNDIDETKWSAFMRILDALDPRHNEMPVIENAVEDLIFRGADVNFKGDRGFTPVEAAAGQCGASIVKILARHGADIDGALHMPAFRGDLRAVEELLKAGANPNNVGEEDGFSVLMSALNYHSNYMAEIVRVLVKYGADINYIDPETGRSCFHFYLDAASAFGTWNERVAEALLDCGADVKLKRRGSNENVWENIESWGDKFLPLNDNLKARLRRAAN
jgi:hypothetical protein